MECETANMPNGSVSTPKYIGEREKTEKTLSIMKSAEMNCMIHFRCMNVVQSLRDHFCDSQNII